MTVKDGLKIDLGCAGIRREGFIRVDNNPKCKPDVLMDMQDYVKTLEDDSVSVVIVSHSIEFLDGWEIYGFMNELYRVVKPAGTVKISVTSVNLPDGRVNPRAWTVPLLKTHFSPDTFKVFTGGPTYRYRDVLPWNIIEKNHLVGGGLVVLMEPLKDHRLTEMRKRLGMDR
jgi:hypothetical protein